MIKGRKGGANTTTGLVFEEEIDLLTLCGKVKDYTIKHNEIYYKDNLIGFTFKKNKLYKYLETNNVNWPKLVSAKLLPDDSLYLPNLKKFIVFEIKYQNVSGSTDEKLQTCHFKIRQYKKLIKALDPEIKVEFIYVLNDWFKDKRYKDVLSYINSVPGCTYYIGKVPLKAIGLH